MAAVSREFLEQLKALAHPDYDRAEIEATLLNRLQNGWPGGLSGLTNWTAAPADNLRRSLPLLAELMFLHGEQENNNRNMGQMVNSQGDYLDVFGVDRGVQRRSGEDDDDYLLRLANSGRRRAIGLLEYYEDESAEFNSDIVDVKAATRSNRQDVNVYALKSGHNALTMAESNALLAHLNLQRKKIAGVQVYVPAVTATAFTIDVTVRHGSEFSADTIAAEARTAIYAWLAAGQKIGDPVYRSAISNAAFVPDAADATVAVPANDLAAAEGVVYTCGANTADVVIRTVVI